MPALESGRALRSDRAIILFVRDEREEARLKPLPRRYRALGYRSVNRSVAARLAPVRESGVDLIIATGGSRDAASPHTVLRQRGTTFGERITNAVADAFALGYRSAVVVGNDCPTISVSDILDAFRALESGAPRAAVPARDGGAVLVGVSREGFDPAGLTALPWTTSRLCVSFLDLPGAVALPSVGEDFDEWVGARADLALKALLGSFHEASSRRPDYPPFPVISPSVRKAMTRFFLTAPPLR